MGTAGCVCPVCSGIRRDRRGGGQPVYARQDLGRGRGAPGRKQASGAGSGETGARYRGRYGASSVSASRFRHSPLINLRTFWPRPEHTQNSSSCIFKYELGSAARVKRKKPTVFEITVGFFLCMRNWAAAHTRYCFFPKASEKKANRNLKHG